METAKLFDDKSDLYVSYRPQYPDNLFEYISSLTDQHDAAWDCATGNGQAAIGLAEHFNHIEATDISENQILNSFFKKNIQYSIQPAETTEFKSNKFDLVNIAQALHWVDFTKFWQEVKRVLKPNGVFVTFFYHNFKLDHNISETVELHIRKKIKPYCTQNHNIFWNSYKENMFRRNRPFSASGNGSILLFFL